MIEAGLVYIYSDQRSSSFHGCGALVEGPFVITCRHVWDQATQAAGNAPVLVCFPPPQGNGTLVFSPATLADACDADAQPPDLVILHVVTPGANSALRIARAGGSESGPAGALVGLVGRNPKQPYTVRDVTISGTIDPRIDNFGLRQFTGMDGRGYWPDRGSSGSPLGLDGGSELVGLLCMSETGLRPGEAAIHEAFVLPASTIHRFLRLHVGYETARQRSIDKAVVPRALDTINAAQFSIADVRQRLAQYFDDVTAHAAVLFPATNSGADIDNAIAESQRLSAAFDAQEALAVLDRTIAKEAHTRKQRLLPLLKEKAKQQRIILDHVNAAATLFEITNLDPDQIWAWLEIGDIQYLIGDLEAALSAYRAGQIVAVKTNSERECSYTYDKIGDILLQKGDNKEALSSFQDCLRLADSVINRDLSDTYWKQELSVAQNKVGNIMLQNGNRKGALALLYASLAIRINLVKTNPDNTTWQRDLSVGHENIGDVLLLEGKRAGALAAFRAGFAIRDVLAGCDPTNIEWQRDLAVSHIRIGDFLRRESNYRGAKEAFYSSLAIRRRISEYDLGNTGSQRDLAIGYDAIGDILRREGNSEGAMEAFSAGLAILQNLVARDPSNARWQYDLASEYIRMGDTFLLKKDHEKSMEMFYKSHGVFLELVTNNPENVDWQRAFAISYDRIGQAMMRQNNGEGAMNAFLASYTIRQRASERDPIDVAWQRSLIVSSVCLSDVDFSNRHKWLERAKLIADNLNALGALAPEDTWMLNDLDSKLAVLWPH